MRSMNSQFSELSQHPNLRRDGAVDVVIAHVTATHPPMSAQVEDGWRLLVGTYSSVRCTSCPIVVGMEPVMPLSSRYLRHPQPVQPLSSESASQARTRCPRKGRATYIEVQGVPPSSWLMQFVKVVWSSSFTPPTSSTLPESNVIANNTRKIDRCFVEAPMLERVPVGTPPSRVPSVGYQPSACRKRVTSGIHRSPLRRAPSQCLICIQPVPGSPANTMPRAVLFDTP